MVDIAFWMVTSTLFGGCYYVIGDCQSVARVFMDGCFSVLDGC